MLTLRILGGAALEDESSSIAGRAVQPRRIALLAVLGLAPRRSLSRDKLVALLWPESDSEQARHLLSVAVYELRKALGEETIITKREELTLSNDVAIDAVHFEQAVAAADYERAAALYGGPLLDGFHISDAPDFEHWVDAERSHLARRYAEALEKLAQQRADAGDTGAALAAWRKLAAHDPYSARYACSLMLALEAAGDRAGALQHARTHSALLHEEFGAQPDPDVEALANRLRHTPRDATIAPAPLNTRPPATTNSIRPPRRRHLIGGATVLIAMFVALIVWQGNRNETSGANAEAVPSIAVLLFDNVSANDSSTYFSDGLSDAIINALSRVPGLRVASRSSSFQFRTPRDDPRDIGRQLDVDYVLEGSVRMSADRITIGAQLVNTSDAFQVWSDDYDVPFVMANFLQIQEEIAQAVVGALAARLGRQSASARIATELPKDMRALESFVSGSRAYHRRTVYDLQRAVAHFDTAIAREPGYARAHAAMAEVYALLGAYDYGALPPQTAFATARAAARRALAIDPNLAEAHNALASVLFNYDWDWSGAEREFVRAIQLSPSYAPAHHWYALLLQCAGREREALQAITRARELDPLSPVIGTALARHYYLARRTDEAIAGYRRIAETDSTFVTARVGLGLSLAARGEYQSAIEQYQTAQRLLPARTPLIDGLMANAYGRLGARANALEHVASIKAVASRRYVPAEYLAVAYIGLGDNDRAFEALEQAFANRSAGLAYLEIEPLVDPLRTDPRFTTFIEKIRAARK